MRKFIAILVMATLTCSLFEKDDGNDDLKFWLAAWMLVQTPGWEYNACRNWSGDRNLIYNTGYHAAFATDPRLDYTTWIRGNSTMDLTNSYAGWYGAGTANRAVSGNTLCDMIEQVPSRPAGNIEFVLVATTGGNDMLRGIPNDRIKESGRIIIEQTRALFPSALIGAITVHPTRVDHVNAGKADVNAGIRAHLDADGNGCWVDVLGAFGKAEGEPADADQMYPDDNIHYNENMAWLVRDAIFASCGRYP